MYATFLPIRCLVRALILCQLLYLFLVNGYVIANPTTVDPNQSLAVHGTLKGVAELVAETEKIDAELAALAEEIDRATASGNADRLPGKKLATSIPRLRQAYRNQTRLLILGEPLGTDLEMRLRLSDHKIQNACLAYAATPAGMKVRNALATKLQKDQPKRLEQYEKILQLAAAGKFAEAEGLLDPIGDELTTQLWFLPLTVRPPFLGPYSEAAAAVEGPMRKMRSAAAIAEINQVIARIKPDPAALDGWGRDVVGQLRAGGTAAWNDRPAGDALEVFDELMRRWKIGHTALQRIAALRWVIRWNGGARGGSESGTPENTTDPLVAEAIAWNDAVLLAAIEIIKADAAKISPAAVPSRHQAYLERLAVMLPSLQSQASKPKLEEAISVLIGTNVDYAKSVKQYAAATKDVMTFRMRMAQAEAKRFASEFPPADGVVREATIADASCRGLYPENRSPTVLATLFEPAKKIMTLRGPKLVNRNVRVESVLTGGGEKRISLSQFAGRTYASYTGMLPTDSAISAAIGSLRSDLLVDQSHLPLSLDSAVAIRNAEVGNFVTVGGRINAAQLESMVTRFASLGLVESTVIPAGAVVQMQGEGDLMTQMAMRLDIVPMWVQHEMFVTAVSVAP